MLAATETTELPDAQGGPCDAPGDYPANALCRVLLGRPCGVTADYAAATLCRALSALDTNFLVLAVFYAVLALDAVRRRSVRDARTLSALAVAFGVSSGVLPLLF